VLRKFATLYHISGLGENVFSVWGKLLLAAILVVTSLFMYLPVATVSALQAVDLNVLGFGATAWNVTGVRPGDSGGGIITLKNSGTQDGNVIIWLSNIRSAEGSRPEATNAGSTVGELDKYIELALSGVAMDTNLAFPTNINNFPQSATSQTYIKLGRLNSGASADFVWVWSMPNLIASQNDAQGDSLTFDINYMIEEIPETPVVPTSPVSPTTPITPGGGGDDGGTSIIPPTTPSGIIGPVRSIQLVVPGAKVVERLVDENNTVAGNMFVKSTDNAVTIPGTPTTPGAVAQTTIAISIPEGAEVLNPAKVPDPAVTTVLPEDAIPHKIEAKILSELPAPIPLPEGWVQVSQFVEVLGYTYGVPHHVTINPPANITLGYDPSLLPAEVEAISLFYFDEDNQRWVQLEAPPGYIAQEGEMAAQVGHFSLFAVLAKGSSDTGTITPPTTPVTPTAKFVVSNLTVTPREIYTGEKATIAAMVTNIGGIAGEYQVTLTLDGKPVAAKTVTLNPGESAPVQFVVNPNLPGTYSIDVNQLNGELDVITLPDMLKPDNPNTWWLLLLGLALVILMSFLFQTGGVLAPVPVGGGQGNVPSYLASGSLKELVIYPRNPSIEAGKLIKFKVLARYLDNSEEDITRKAEWEIKELNVARVDNKGLVKGLSAGVATVTARWRGKTVGTLLGVNGTVLDTHTPIRMQVGTVAGGDAIKAVTLLPAEQTITISKKQAYRALLQLENGKTKDVTDEVTWFSTNDFVADINRAGVATGYSAGVTAIIATYKGRKGIATLTVIRQPD